MCDKIYVKESTKLLKELNDTNSFFSLDSDAYKNFNRELKTMTERLENAKTAGIADEKSVLTVLAGFQSVKAHCTQYINEHKELEELSTRQANRLGVMQKFLKLCTKPEDRVCAQENRTRHIAEDLTVKITRQNHVLGGSEYVTTGRKNRQ